MSLNILVSVLQIDKLLGYYHKETGNTFQEGGGGSYEQLSGIAAKQLGIDVPTPVLAKLCGPFPISVPIQCIADKLKSLHASQLRQCIMEQSHALPVYPLDPSKPSLLQVFFCKGVQEDAACRPFALYVV